jgi:hypothetical protein
MQKYNFALALLAITLVAMGAVALGYSPEHMGLLGLTGYAAVAVQSSYAERQQPAVAGMIAEGPYESITRTCDTVAGIGFGVAVAQGSADKTAILAGVAGDFLGVSIRDITLVHSDSTNLDKYKRYENMGIMTEGVIWVAVDGAVNAGDNVTYDTTTGKFGTIGADGTHLAVTGGRWDTTAADTGLAKLRLSGFAHSA